MPVGDQHVLNLTVLIFNGVLVSFAVALKSVENCWLCTEENREAEI